MKHHLRYSILIMLSFFAIIGLVFAVPAPIGLTKQPQPFESNPTAAVKAPVVTAWSVGTTASVFDGDDFTSAILRTTATTSPTSPATLTFSGFTTPVPPEGFTADWVDLKIIYEVPTFTSTDMYRFEYTVAGAAGWTVLLPDTSWTAGAFAKAVRPWAQIVEPVDGVWDWADISGLSVRVVFSRAVGDTAWDTGKSLILYEIWATVYPFPLPPTASTTMSVQPPVVMGVTPNPGTTFTDNVFFVDVYGQNFASLAGYEFTLQYDTSIITFADAFGYWPWIDVVVTPDDAAGLVSVVSSANPPISDTGIDGNSPLARVYFTVDSGGTTMLHFLVHLMGLPNGDPINHTPYDGFFSSPHYLSFQGSLFPGGDPTNTVWHEDYPTFSRTWTVTGWTDNGDGDLTASDQLLIEVGGVVKPYHVDQVTVTIHWTFKPLPSGEGLADPEDPSTIPVPPEFVPTDTRWHQIYPVYSRAFGISGWVDNGDGFFSPSDQFTITYDDDGSVADAHLDAITTNILVSEKPTEVPEFPLGIGLAMVIALAIPTAYIWRTRKQRRV